MTNLSITAAAKAWGMSRRTLQRRVTDGTISVTSGKGKAKYLETSEMLRVFGEPDVTSAQGAHVTAPVMSQETSEIVTLLKEQNKYLKSQVEIKDGQIAELNKQLSDLRRPILPRLIPWMK